MLESICSMLDGEGPTIYKYNHCELILRNYHRLIIGHFRIPPYKIEISLNSECTLDKDNHYQGYEYWMELGMYYHNIEPSYNDPNSRDPNFKTCEQFQITISDDLCDPKFDVYKLVEDTCTKINNCIRNNAKIVENVCE